MINSKKGEIVTGLTLAAFVFVTVSAIIANSQLNKKGHSTSASAQSTCDDMNWYCAGECANQQVRGTFNGTYPPDGADEWRNEKAGNCNIDPINCQVIFSCGVSPTVIPTITIGPPTPTLASIPSPTIRFNPTNIPTVVFPTIQQPSPTRKMTPALTPTLIIEPTPTNSAITVAPQPTGNVTPSLSVSNQEPRLPVFQYNVQGFIENMGQGNIEDLRIYVELLGEVNLIAPLQNAPVQKLIENKGHFISQQMRFANLSYYNLSQPYTLNFDRQRPIPCNIWAYSIFNSQPYLLSPTVCYQGGMNTVTQSNPLVYDFVLPGQNDTNVTTTNQTLPPTVMKTTEEMVIPDCADMSTIKNGEACIIL